MLSDLNLTVAHDSVVFGFVSVFGPSSSPQSNEVFLFIALFRTGTQFHVLQTECFVCGISESTIPMELATGS